MSWGVFRSTARVGASLCLVAVVLSASVAASSAETLRGESLPPCTTFDRPVALAMDPARLRPIAFARDRTIVAFPTYGTRDSVCHGIHGVTSVAAAAADDSFWIAHDNVVDHVVPLNNGGSWIPITLRPCGPNDRVEAVALNHAEQLEVAVTTGGDASKSRLLLFSRLAHDAAIPVRTVTSTALSSAVDDVAFDSRGALYVYDDAGEILTFASNASGADVQPQRVLAGRRTYLRPASPGVAGTRHLVVDDAGDIAATDLGIAITFAPNATGDSEPTDVIETEGATYGIGVTRTGGLFVLSGFGRVDSYAPMVLRVDKSRAGIPYQSMEIVK